MSDAPFSLPGIERVFHSPNRLRVLSCMDVAGAPVSFSRLKEACSMTDGNLMHHMVALRRSRVVRIVNAENSDGRAYELTPDGLGRFREYLRALAHLTARVRSGVGGG